VIYITNDKVEDLEGEDAEAFRILMRTDVALPTDVFEKGCTVVAPGVSPSSFALAANGERFVTYQIFIPPTVRPRDVAAFALGALFAQVCARPYDETDTSGRVLRLGYIYWRKRPSIIAEYDHEIAAWLLVARCRCLVSLIASVETGVGIENAA
jgi:hypothetical protein